MKNYLITITLLISHAISAQTRLVENVHYDGNTHLEIPESGLSFIIPEGWSGRVPSGSSFMILTDAGDKATMILISSEATETEMNQELRNQIQLDEGIYITPEGQVNQEGQKWSGNYQVIGFPQEMKGYVEARLGSYGIALACMILATPDDIQDAKKAVVRLMNSLAFTQPQQQEITNGNPDTSGEGIGQAWSDYLKQKSLKYFYSMSDFSETDFIFLCPDGSFSRNTSSYSGGITGSGTIRGSYADRWQATGEGNTGTLTLFNEDGTSTGFNIFYGEGNKGTGIYLNGYRFYAEITNNCD